MSIKLRIDTTLSYYTNQQRLIEIDGNTVGECLENLVKQYPDFARVMYYRDNKLTSLISVFIVDEDGLPVELPALVKEGDELFISFASVD